jgi:glycine oxidase
VADARIWNDELTAAQRSALSPGVPGDLNRRPDVLVVGGGLVGLATAVACRRAGLGRVVVVEREPELAGAASGGNGGAIAPDMHRWTDPPAFVAFGRASLAAYRRLDAEWDGALGLREDRWLCLVAPDQPIATDLDAAAIREVEPDVRPPDGYTGLLVEGQAAVNPRRLAAALAQHAGTVATGVAWTGVRVDGDRIAVVHTTAGDFHPGAVVMATGLVPQPWAGNLRQRWVKGHMVAVGPGPWRLRHTVSSDVGGGRPLPGGGVVCGGTFDEGDDSREVRPEVAAGLAAGLARVVPAARDATVTHRWCCFRPRIEGRQPVIDRLPGTSNGWLSAGHFTTGVMMAAGTGEALAAWIASGDRPLGTDAFAVPAPADRPLGDGEVDEPAGEHQ